MSFTYNKTKPRAWFENPDALSQPLNTPRTYIKEPNWLWVSKNTTRRIVILDAVPSTNLKFHIDSQNSYKKVLCIQQHDNCPICSVADNNGRFGRGKDYVVVTVIDEQPWTTKDGKTIPYSKKLLPIENEMQRKQILKYITKFGTARGLVFEMTRTGTKGEGSCGVPSFEEFLTEEELLAKFGNGEIKSPEGKLLKEANSDIKPFDYGKMFPLPTAVELRTKFSIASPVGVDDGLDTNDVEYGEVGYDVADDDEIPF